ncbi:MAG: peptidoglycan DD-metalloendopeptidase family protein [Wujia sp.]
MEPLAFRSYERKIIAAFVLLLGLCGLMGYHAYREQRIQTVYLEDGKQVLTGSSTQTFTRVEQYYAPNQLVYDDSMYKDEMNVEQEAVPGVREITVLTSYYNGRELDSRILEEDVVEEAVPKVVHIGTRERPQYEIPVEDYIISSGFGWRWGRNHDGVDMAVSVGSPVVATDDGVVIRSEYYGGYGYCIDIDHGEGIVSRYGHLSRMDVNVGQSVKQGEQIALSGNTGNSTGPHLHFELRINGVAVNPCNYIDF